MSSDDNYTPWHVGFRHVVYDARNVCVAADLSEYHAHWIVEAVNSHEELLEAAQYMVEAAKEIGTGHKMAALEQLEQAIDKAEGRM